MEIWKLFCAGFATDEYGDNKEITALITRLVEDLCWAVDRKKMQQNFN